MLRLKSVQELAEHRDALVLDHSTRRGDFLGEEGAMILLTRRRAALTTISAYSTAIMVGGCFFFYLADLQGSLGDGRAEQMAIVFGIIMTILCFRALYTVYRRPKMLDV